jgi:hypothetical protein
MAGSPSNEDLRLPIAFRVGVTGRRHLKDEAVAPLRAQIRNCLTIIKSQIASREREERVAAVVKPRAAIAALQVVSPLAEGADRLVAEEALELGAGLRAPLPFSAAEYELDFPDTVAAFRALLAKSVVFTLDGLRDDGPARQESYQAVGQFVVRNSDLLIAIWDGERERGLGGTAEIVRFAIASGLAVWWIDETGSRPARLLSTPADLSALQHSQAGSAAEESLRVLVDRCVAPPEAGPAEEGGLFGWFARIGAGKFEAQPFVEFLDERPLSLWWLWRANATLMRWISPPVEQRAPQSEPAKSELERYWRRLFIAVDASSGAYGDRYRSSYVLIALLAVIALSAAAASGESLQALEVAYILVELAALVGIAALVEANRRHRWHERWISYRLLAELCRKQFALCVIGRALPGADVLRLTFDSAEPDLAPREAWVTWYFMAAMRAASFPQGEMSAAKRRAVEIGRSLLAEQIAYHKSRLERMSGAGRRIGQFSEWFFGFTLLIAFVKLLSVLGGLDRVVHWGGLAGAFLSAFAGACVGIRAYAEFSMLERQSAYMIRVLRQAETDLEAASLAVDQPLSSVQIGDTLHATTAAMMQDITGWAHLFRIKTIEAG